MTKTWAVALFLLGASAGASHAEVILACTFPTLPPAVFRYPDDPAAPATLEVGGRPTAVLTRGQGTDRVESATVDGYAFQFTPANLAMLVTKDAAQVATETGKCATIGGPVAGAALTLAAPADTTPPPSPEDHGKWQIQEDKSQLDDSATVILSVDSTATIAGQYGSAGPATLVLRCQEGTTSAFMTLNDMFLADIEGFGTVNFRIDDKKADKVQMRASTDNKALGLWDGRGSIPFIKKLMAGQKVVFRATPMSESPVEFSFDLAGLTPAIASLRKACKW